MKKAVNLDILRTSKNNDFIQELKRSPKIIDKRDAQQYFQILMIRFTDNSSNRITKAILSTIYELISTRDDILNVFAQKRFFLSLPYSARIYNCEIMNILYVIMDKAPETIVNGLEPNFKELIQYECKKSLFLLYLYINHFKTLEKDQTKILELLVDKDCSQRLSAYATTSEYVLLLDAVFERSESFRKEHSKEAWQIIYKILKETDSTDIINYCYMTLARIESYYQTDKVDFELANSHLQNEEIQDSVLSLLFYAPFENQSIIKNEGFISYLAKLSQKSGLATLILVDICTKSEKATDYLSKHNDWLKIDHQFCTYTLCLFLIVYKSKGESMELGKEFSGLLFKICDSANSEESNQGSVIKIIATLLRKVRINIVVFDELCKKKSFFKNLIDLTIKKNKSFYFFQCALIADFIFQFIKSDESAASKYIDVLPNFCQIIKSGVSSNSQSFYQFCLIGTKLSKFKQVKDKFNELNIQEILKEKANDEKTKKPAERFLKKLAQKDE